MSEVIKSEEERKAKRNQHKHIHIYINICAKEDRNKIKKGKKREIRFQKKKNAY